MATIVLAAVLVSSCASAPSSSSSAKGGAQPGSPATTPTTDASVNNPGPLAGGSGGPCGGLSREDVEAVFGAPVRLTHGPPGDPGRLANQKGIVAEDVCSANDGTNNANQSYSYWCMLSLGRFDSVADARASFEGRVKLDKLPPGAAQILAPGEGPITLSLGDASTSMIIYGIGSASILKTDNLLDVMCTAGSVKRDGREIKLNRDAFVSLVRKTASRL
jgi:hypothetical protein